MRARIALSSLLCCFLLTACGSDAPAPVTPHSSAVTCDAGIDASDGIGTSPSVDDNAMSPNLDDDPIK